MDFAITEELRQQRFLIYRDQVFYLYDSTIWLHSYANLDQLIGNDPLRLYHFLELGNIEVCQPNPKKNLIKKRERFIFLGGI